MSSGRFYDMLGVAPDADQDAIRAAYIEKAKQYHSDKNPGDKIAEEQFKVLGKVYDVLKDPEKRAFYDAHGAAPEDAPARSENTELYMMIQRGIVAALQNTLDPTSIDLIEQVRKSFRHDIAQMKAQMREAEGSLTRTKDVQARVIVKDGEENIVAKIMQQQVDGIQTAITNGQHTIKEAERALEMLKDYQYRVEEGPVAGFPERARVSAKHGPWFDIGSA